MRLFQVIIILAIILITIIIILVIDSYRKKTEFKDSYNEKDECYKSLLTYMSAIIYERKHEHLYTNYLNSNLDINDYYLNMVQRYFKLFECYAENNVLSSIEKFNNNPTEDTYQDVAEEMRKVLERMKMEIN